MLGYRCYFIGQNGQFISVTVIKAEDDDEALMLAQRLYAIHAESVLPHCGFEIWEGARRVYSEPKL